MTKILTNKQVIEFHTKCDRCKHNTTRGAFQAQLDDNSWIFFCEGCHKECEYRGGKAY
jgi:hypothetical protein